MPGERGAKRRSENGSRLLGRIRVNHKFKIQIEQTLLSMDKTLIERSNRLARLESRLLLVGIVFLPMILALSAMIFFCSVRSVLSGYTVIQKYRFTVLLPKLLEKPIQQIQRGIHEKNKKKQKRIRNSTNSFSLRGNSASSLFPTIVILVLNNNSHVLVLNTNN